jgi:hypothetical protein
MIYGELEYDPAAECWEGFDDHWTVRVPRETMIEAYHICAMRGMSRTHYSRWPHDVDPWLTDETLQELEGVEIEAR